MTTPLRRRASASSVSATYRRTLAHLIALDGGSMSARASPRTASNLDAAAALARGFGRGFSKRRFFHLMRLAANLRQQPHAATQYRRNVTAFYRNRATS
jgi:hypothetical protein